MNSVIYKLLSQWPELDDELELQLRSMPDYPVLKSKLEAATRQLEAALSQDAHPAYLQFEAAGNAMNTLWGTASFLCGFRFCARLLTGILFTS